MRAAQPLLLLTFDGIHDVLRAERVLKEHGIECDLVPTPRELSSDCGMSVELRAVDREAIDELRTSGLLHCNGMYG